MDNSELKKMIDDMPTYVPVRTIELEVGMPITTLQKSLKGDISLPKKWEKPLLKYLGKSKPISVEPVGKKDDLPKPENKPSSTTGTNFKSGGFMSEAIRKKMGLK